MIFDIGFLAAVLFAAGVFSGWRRYDRIMRQDEWERFNRKGRR